MPRESCSTVMHEAIFEQLMPTAVPTVVATSGGSLKKSNAHVPAHLRRHNMKGTPRPYYNIENCGLLASRSSFYLRRFLRCPFLPCRLVSIGLGFGLGLGLGFG